MQVIDIACDNMALYSRKTETSFFVLVMLQFLQISTAEHNFTDCCKSPTVGNNLPHIL